MSSRGFVAIGLHRPKTHHNIGMTLRAAFCFDAQLVVLEGDRTSAQSHCDTTKAWKNMPVVRGNLEAQMPYGATPVAVDLVEDAENLVSFQHPLSAYYVFGPEDGTLGEEQLRWCKRRVVIPTRYCLNLAMAVNVILYDRHAKMDRMQRGISNKNLVAAE